MPNDTVRANAQSLPIDRRAELGSLAAGGALLASPRASEASEHPDADLIAFAGRVRQLGLEWNRALCELADIEDNFELPPAPTCLVVREGDAFLAGLHDEEMKTQIGKPFSVAQLRIARKTRAAIQKILTVQTDDPDVRERALEMIARVWEVDIASARYLADIELAKEAAGIPAAETRANALGDQMRDAMRTLAFMSARTADGVVAKLAAVAMDFERRLLEKLDPANWGVDYTLQMIAVEANDLHKAWAA